MKKLLNLFTRLVKVTSLSLLLVSTAFAASENTPGITWWPEANSTSSRNPTFITATIDAADEKKACIFQVAQSGEVSDVYFRTKTVTTGADVTVGLYTVDTGSTGYPTTTLFDTSSSTTFTINDTDDNMVLKATLDATCTVNQGDWVALVISNPSSSFGNIQLAEIDISAWPLFTTPYQALYTSSWAKDYGTMICGLEYSGGAKYDIAGVYLFDDHNAQAFTSLTSSYGGRIKFPVKCTVRHISIWGENNFGNVRLKIYNTAGTLLHNQYFYSGRQYNHTRARMQWTLDTDFVMEADTNYYFMMEAQDTSSSYLNYYTLDAAGDFDMNSAGQHLVWVERSTGGTFTVTDTKAPIMSLGIVGFETTTGGGGSSSSRGWSL